MVFDYCSPHRMISKLCDLWIKCSIHFGPLPSLNQKCSRLAKIESLNISDDILGGIAINFFKLNFILINKIICFRTTMHIRLNLSNSNSEAFIQWWKLDIPFNRRFDTHNRWNSWIFLLQFKFIFKIIEFHLDLFNSRIKYHFAHLSYALTMKTSFRFNNNILSRFEITWQYSEHGFDNK